MAITRKELRRRIEKLEKQFEPAIAAAFRRVIDDVTDEISINQLTAAIDKNDFDAVIRTLNIDAAAFAPLTEALRNSFIAGGTLGTEAFPRPPRGFSPEKIVFRFDVRNPGAERWLSNRSSTLITNLTNGTREAVRGLLASGLERGSNPRTTALDIVGRVNNRTRKREGGIIGLNRQQERYLAAARAELYSTDVAQLKKYLARNRRDRRFDSIVLSAIEKGERLPSDIASRAATSYSNRLLQLRGEVIARTETLQSLNAGKFEATAQGLQRAGLDEDAVTRIWSDSGDSRVRDTHDEGAISPVKGMRTPFNVNGSLLLFPGDTSLGADPAETISCRCNEFVDVDYSVGVT